MVMEPGRRRGGPASTPAHRGPGSPRGHVDQRKFGRIVLICKGTEAISVPPSAPPEPGRWNPPPPGPAGCGVKRKGTGRCAGRKGGGVGWRGRRCGIANCVRGLRSSAASAAGAAAIALWPGTVPTLGRADRWTRTGSGGSGAGICSNRSRAGRIRRRSSCGTWRSSIDCPTPVSTVRRFTGPAIANEPCAAPPGRPVRRR
jgi:hypothetical protein